MSKIPVKDGHGLPVCNPISECGVEKQDFQELSDLTDGEQGQVRDKVEMLEKDT